LRLPAAVCGVLMVPAMAWLATRWLGRGTAVVAAWLAALSPFLVWYSQEARNYTMVMLTTCVAGALLLGLGGAPRPAALARYGVALWAGMLSNFSFALLGPLHVRWWLAGDGHRGRRLLAMGAVGAVVLLLLTPWFAAAFRIWDFHRLRPGDVAATGAPLRGPTTFHPAAIPYALHAFAVGYTLGPSLRELKAAPTAETLRRHVPAIALTALVFGTLGILGLRAVAKRGRLSDAALWLLVPMLIVSWFALRNFKVFHPRYLAVCVPGVLLVLAAGLADLPRRARIAAWVAIGALWAVALAQHYFDPRFGKEDYRGALALVQARGVTGEKVVAVGAPEPVFYYYRGPLATGTVWLGFAANPPRLERAMDEALAGVRGGWVVLSRAEDLDPRGSFADFMDRRYPDAPRFRFEGVQVWHIGAVGN
jgi:4-amino-4-deoxy-L-arabinose transferase-like glycosyltransferase